jgi:hypothetical protein
MLWVRETRNHIVGKQDQLTNIVLAQYLFRLAEAESTAWKLKAVALASYTVAVLCMWSPRAVLNWQFLTRTVLVFDTKWSLRLANAIGFIKLVTLILYVAVYIITMASSTQGG